jgi:nucleoside-diphosphate-sugar epimerase
MVWRNKMRESLKGQTVLITGAGGFVGGAAVRSLAGGGANVVALLNDIQTPTMPWPAKNCSIVRGSILDKERLSSILSKYEVSYVLHLASQAIVRKCDNDPYLAYQTNIMGAVNLFEACRNLKRGPKKVVVMTSDKAYGPAPVPYKEDTPLVGCDTYGTSKLCQDAISLSYAKTYGVPNVTVRAGNIYGPGDHNVSRLIPGSILKLLAGKSPMLYSGVYDYIREFIYVDDMLEAFYVLFDQGEPGQAYNVGGTDPCRIGHVIEMIRDKIDPSINIDVVEKEFYEIKEQFLDASKLRGIGWEPKIFLSEGLDKTIDWYKSGSPSI